MKIKQINDNNFSDILKSSNKPLVIKFHNPTCHLCIKLKSIFEKISDSYDDYEFGEIIASKNKKLSKFFKIEGVPSLFIVSDFKKIEIPYPENPDPESGYSFYDIADFLDTFKR